MLQQVTTNAEGRRTFELHRRTEENIVSTLRSSKPFCYNRYGYNKSLKSYAAVGERYILRGVYFSNC